MQSLRIASLMVLGALAIPALGQPFPSKPITFIYPYPPGLNADTAWRTLGAEIGKRLGQPLTHDNRPGAGGDIDRQRRNPPQLQSQKSRGPPAFFFCGKSE